MRFDQTQFETLYQISRMLSAAVYPDSLIRDALDLVIAVLRAERGLFVRLEESVHEIDPSTTGSAASRAEKIDPPSFKIIAARNVGKENITDLSSFSSGILQRVITTGEPCLHHDVQSDPQLSQFQSVQIHHIKSVIGVPIRHQDEIWGVILIDSRETRQEFTEENLQFLKFFANLVSLALDRLLALETLQHEVQILRQQLQAPQNLPDIIGESPAMRKLSALIHKVAPTDATVLLLGESGTGKDLTARALHHLSPRKDRPFLAQFCGSIPDTLLESELFGYKKGAFTGATSDKKGLFEAAEGGTFFLDEIADISPALQAKLLRVLQSREIISLGDLRTKKIDVRIIVATNKNLQQLVKDGVFREDLFYRLNVFPITLPPLRHRREDIPLLAAHFLKKMGPAAMRLPPETLKKLREYSWPGNVRQLENVLQRALILSEGGKVLPQHLELEENELAQIYIGTLRDLERNLLMRRLEECGGNRTLTASSLGVSVRWVQKKLKEMGKA